MVREGRKIVPYQGAHGKGGVGRYWDGEMGGWPFSVMAGFDWY